jgi:diguanylate cyclase (GGDEF)-like protein
MSGQYDRLDITTQELQHFYMQIAKLITSTIEIDEIIDVVMKQISLFFKPNNWSLMRIDPVTQELYFVVLHGLDNSQAKNTRFKLGEGVAGYVAQTGEAKVVEDVSKEPLFSPLVDQLAGFRTQSIIAVPIKFQETILGVIELINTLGCRPFTAQELDILQTIADFTAIALTNALRYQRMMILAIRDSLTGLYNRSRLDKMIIEMKRSHFPQERRSIQNLILVVSIDADNLKNINDSLGHAKGDEALKSIANQLQSCCRDNDFAFRTGGDEFLLVLTNLDEATVMLVKKRLNEKLKKLSRITHLSNGFSYGMAYGERFSLEDLMEEADKQMYSLKSVKRKESQS